MRRSEHNARTRFSRAGVIPTIVALVALVALPGTWIAAAAPAAATLPSAECTQSDVIVTCTYTNPHLDYVFVVPSGVSVLTSPPSAARAVAFLGSAAGARE